MDCTRNFVSLGDDRKADPSTAALMTPSSSGRTVRFLEPMFPSPIPFPYLSPTPSPARGNESNPRELVDIVGELYLFGPLEMARKVLQYLDPADLFRCLLVSKIWYNVVSEDDYLMRILVAHRKEKARKRKRSRTLTSENIAVELLPRSSARPALLDMDMNSSLFSIAPPPESSFTDPSSDSSTLKRRPCPNCKSLAKVLHLRRAVCEACKFDFCGHCLKAYHDGFCKTREELWGEDHDGGPSRIHIVGNKTKVVKKRLRRL